MKLYRFVAPSHHKAITKIHEVLGPDALLYSTRNLDEGIEIVAGAANSPNVSFDEMNYKPTRNNPSHIKNLEKKVVTMSETIENLTNHINLLSNLLIKDKEKRPILIKVVEFIQHYSQKFIEIKNILIQKMLRKRTVLKRS